MKCLRVTVMVLVIIGALNWGLVGFFDYNLIADIFGGYGTTAARTVFALVGIAGLVAAVRFVHKCYHCCHSCGPCNPCGSSSSCKCCGKGPCQCKKY